MLAATSASARAIALARRTQAGNTLLQHITQSGKLQTASHFVEKSRRWQHNMLFSSGVQRRFHTAGDSIVDSSRTPDASNQKNNDNAENKEKQEGQVDEAYSTAALPRSGGYRERTKQPNANDSSSYSSGDEDDDFGVARLTMQRRQSSQIASSFQYSQTTGSFNVVRISNDGTAAPSELGRQQMLDLGLKSRDVRLLVSNLNFPTILARSKCILVDVRDTHAIITSDAVYLLQQKQGGSLVDVVSYIQSDIQRAQWAEKGKHNTASEEAADTSRELYEDAEGRDSLPFEFKCLEALLQHICMDIDREYLRQYNRCQQMIQDPNLILSEERLYELLQLKQEVQRFGTFVRELHESIEGLLQSDEDLVSMYLTDKSLQIQRKIDEHQEVEYLLETYFTRIEEASTRFGEIVSEIESTRDFVNICLDTMRNRMMELELKVSIGGFALTAAAMVAGIFGMNLINGLEHVPGAFHIVASSILLASWLAFFAIIRSVRSQGLFKESFPMWWITKQRKVRTRATLRPLIENEFVNKKPGSV